jgi:hypothetical protein
MDSEVFFEKEQAKRKGKKGLYVIECPLFSSSCVGKPNEDPVYKVGYVYQSLAVRIADYRTHYGKIQFKIHVIWKFQIHQDIVLISHSRQNREYIRH